jgi:endo-1,4-beta-mannosidase
MSYKQSISILAVVPPFVLASSALLGGAEGVMKSSSCSKLSPVHLDGTYFAKDGKRFMPVGAHWVPAKAAMQWPLQWDPAGIEADFAKMHGLGFNMARFDMLWAWFEPRPGDYNPEAFKQFDYLISLAHKYQIYLNPSLFIGGEVGEAYWDVSWRYGRNPQTDPDMLRLETDHASELARRYGNESAIIAWDLTDEPPFWIVAGQTTDAMAINWTRLIVGAIRKFDRLHPIVIGTSGQEITHGPFRSDNLAKEVDFLSVHPFTIYRQDLFPDPMLSERSTYGAAFEIALSSGAGRPAMIHEMGGSTAQYSPARVALYDRANMYSGLGAGGIGVDLWCYTDAAPEQWHKAPYLRTPQETKWGMTTWDRQDKPLAREFRKFSKVAEQLDLEGLKPADAEAAIIIPYEWAKPHGDFSKMGLSGTEAIPYLSTADGDGVALNGQVNSNVGASENTWLMGSLLTSFILTRRAGLKADFPREYGEWEARPLLLMPSPLTSTGTPFLCHVHTDFYKLAKNYVENGGVLYASVAADAAIPDMESLFGAHLVDTNTATDITIKVVKQLGTLKPGDIFHFIAPGANSHYWGSVIEADGGQVIAVDQDGRPALVANTLGKGKTLLCAYPLESYLAVTPSAFEKSVSLDALYQALQAWSGIVPIFRSDQPSVEITTLKRAGSGFAVLVNHSAGAKEVTITSTQVLHTLRRITPEGPQMLMLEGSGWKMEVEPFDGAIVEWK